MSWLLSFSISTCLHICLRLNSLDLFARDSLTHDEIQIFTDDNMAMLGFPWYYSGGCIPYILHYPSYILRGILSVSPVLQV
jgi:hypothetical protein